MQVERRLCANLPEVTVIIPAHNEQDHISYLLDSISLQTRLPRQVIVADSQSTDETASASLHYLDRLPCLRVVPAPRGAAAARNFGASCAEGGWYLFLDADVTLPPDFIERLSQIACEGGHKIYTASFVCLDEGYRLLSKLLCLYFKAFSRTRAPALLGHCILVPAEVHALIGGFDESLSLGEDHDYAYRANRAGVDFRWQADLRLYASARRFKRQGFMVTLKVYAVDELRRVLRIFITSRNRRV
jgi:glycosyltransferase involved in cell wall biosynthesis